MKDRYRYVNKNALFDENLIWEVGCIKIRKMEKMTQKWRCVTVGASWTNMCFDKEAEIMHNICEMLLYMSILRLAQFVYNYYLSIY